MDRFPNSMRWLPVAGASALMLALFGAGCSEDLAPQIVTLSASPECEVLWPPVGGTAITVTFSMRATGGNPKGEPTGANVPLDVTWDFGDGMSESNKSLVTHDYAAIGDYTVTVIVKDEDGDQDTRTLQVQVLSADAAITTEPTASSPVPVMNGATVTGYNVEFNAASTVACVTNPLGSQFLYTWDFGDGTTPLEGRPVTHLYPATPGTYNPTVTTTVLNTGAQKIQPLPPVVIP